MSDPSARLGLLKPTGADGFDTEEIADNLQLIDDSPGRRITNLAGVAAIVSAWGAAQEGMEIIVTDATPAPLIYRWTGSAFTRATGPYALGYLGSTARTSDFTTTNATPQTVVSKTVTIPAGGRSIQVIATWPGASGDDGAVLMAMYRDATQIDSWKVQGETGAAAGLDMGQGGSHVVLDPAPAAASVAYTFRIGVPAGLSGEVVAEGAATRPTRISVIEV